MVKKKPYWEPTQKSCTAEHKKLEPEMLFPNVTRLGLINHISFSTTLFILVEEIHESCSRGNLETFSQLTSSSQSPLQQKVLKVESLQELDRLSNIPSLSVGLVLVKMTSPYLPASPKIKLEKKLSFNVLLIHQKDWHRVSF